VAKSGREMKKIMKNPGKGKYVRKKKLDVNVEKTKMMVLNNRKRKSEKNEWKWEERKIERVNEFKYLGYTFNERAHIREMVRKVVGCVRGIGERNGESDFRRRMMMFESMIESISMYEAEIWVPKE
jgi:hypothetical protein